MPDASSLESLALARFGRLTPAEIKLVRLAPDGGYVRCGPSENEDDPTNDASKGNHWGPERQIGNELIRWLCVDREAKQLIDPVGIALMGAKIIGDIDLLYISVPFPLTFHHCNFEGQLNLENSSLPSLDISGSTVGFIRADGAVIKGGVLLRKGFCALGGVRMVGTEIGSTLDLSNATLMSKPHPASSEVGMALRADRLVVKASVYMDEKFRAEGAVSLLGAQIGGELYCAECVFANPFRKGIPNSGTALMGKDMKVGGTLSFTDEFSSIGQIQLTNAHIGGEVDCLNASFANGPDPRPSDAGIILSASGIMVDGSINLASKFHGGIDVKGAKIGRDFNCRGAWVENPPRPALDLSGFAIAADGGVVNGNVFLSDGFHASGLVKLTGLRVGLDLDCHGGTFSNPFQNGAVLSGRALNVEQAVIGEDVILNNLTAIGEVGMLGIQIGGDLNCIGATMLNGPVSGAPEPTGYAFSANGAIIKRSIFLRHSRTEGEVRLPGCLVGGHVECGGTKIDCPLLPSGSGAALYADSIQVGGNFVFGQPSPVPGMGLVPIGSNINGDVNLVGAQIGGDLECMASRFNGVFRAERMSIKRRLYWIQIVDPGIVTLDLKQASAGDIADEQSSWPSKGKLDLDGFDYSRFSEGPVDAKSRLNWLARMSSFSPQPYLHLSTVLKNAGDLDGATAVIVEMESRGRAKDGLAATLSSMRRTWDGYGYYPTNGAVLGLIAIWGIGWVIFRRAELVQTMAPTEKEAYNSLKLDGSLPPHYPPFRPWIYSLDSSLPLARLGQRDKWNPDPNPQSVAIQWQRWTGHLRHLKRGWFVLHPLLLIRMFFRQIVRLMIWLRYRTANATLLRCIWFVRSLLRRGMRWSMRISFMGTSPRLQRVSFCGQVVLGWVLATLLAASIAAKFIRKL
jgi:hypothetical protein